MRLHNIGEVNDFLETVDRCKGVAKAMSGLSQPKAINFI